VYATLQKGNQIKYSIHADFVPEIQQYVMDASLKILMFRDKINGDYELTINIKDSRAQNFVSVVLGTL